MKTSKQNRPCLPLHDHRLELQSAVSLRASAIFSWYRLPSAGTEGQTPALFRRSVRRSRHSIH
jgi:hypothetical protein